MTNVSVSLSVHQIGTKTGEGMKTKKVPWNVGWIWVVEGVELVWGCEGKGKGTCKNLVSVVEIRSLFQQHSPWGATGMCVAYGLRVMWVGSEVVMGVGCGV